MNGVLVVGVLEKQRCAGVAMLRSAGRRLVDFDHGCVVELVESSRSRKFARPPRTANRARTPGNRARRAPKSSVPPSASHMKKARKAPASSFDASPPRSSSAPGARSTAPAASTTSTDGVQAFASVAAFAFEPEMDGELPLQKGEQVYVFPEIVTSPGWWLAAVDGQPAPGLVPPASGCVRAVMEAKARLEAAGYTLVEIPAPDMHQVL